MRRYVEKIRSDTCPDDVYHVIVQSDGNSTKALVCTCPDDTHRGHLRPCKHRQRAELAPAYREAQTRLLQAGRLPGHRDDASGIARFAVVFRAKVDALVAEGVKPSQAVISAIRDVIRAARMLPEGSRNEQTSERDNPGGACSGAVDEGTVSDRD